MAKKSRQNFFWVSYSDLMTSLFFIMLLLFVLASGGMYLDKEATEEQLRKIEQIQQAVNKLPKQYFIEDTTYQRWTIKQEFSPAFKDRDYNIYALNDTSKLIAVGNSLIELVKTLNELKQQEAYRDMNISYLVVIEGMASKDSYADNDVLSYRRALSLYNLWQTHGISFEESQCEVQISGSGVRGIRPHNKPYYEAIKKGDPNAENLFDKQEEKRNQCIIVQIVPKISNI